MIPEHPLHMLNGDRELLLIQTDGRIVFPDDLTLNEAKYVIVQLIEILKEKYGLRSDSGRDEVSGG